MCTQQRQQPRWTYGKQERLEYSNMFAYCNQLRRIGWRIEWTNDCVRARAREKQQVLNSLTKWKKRCNAMKIERTCNVGNISNKLHEESSFIYFDEKPVSDSNWELGAQKDTLKLTKKKKNQQIIHISSWTIYGRQSNKMHTNTTERTDAEPLSQQVEENWIRVNCSVVCPHHLPLSVVRRPTAQMQSACMKFYFKLIVARHAPNTFTIESKGFNILPSRSIGCYAVGFILRKTWSMYFFCVSFCFLSSSWSVRLVLSWIWRFG